MVGSVNHQELLEQCNELRTANGDADWVSILIRNGDVDVGGQVAAVELRRKVLVHVQRDGIDIQLMTSKGKSSSELTSAIKKRVGALTCQWPSHRMAAQR